MTEGDRFCCRKRSRPGGNTRRSSASAGGYSSAHSATRSWLSFALAPCTAQQSSTGCAKHDSESSAVAFVQYSQVQRRSTAGFAVSSAFPHGDDLVEQSLLQALPGSAANLAHRAGKLLQHDWRSFEAEAALALPATAMARWCSMAPSPSAASRIGAAELAPPSATARMINAAPSTTRPAQGMSSVRIMFPIDQDTRLHSNATALTRAPLHGQLLLTRRIG